MITGIFIVYFRPASVLFDPESTFSYVSVYLALGFDSVSKPLAIPIYVSTPIGDSLVVDRVYRSCVVSFAGRETLVGLLVLDMIDFDVIFGYGLVGSLSCCLRLFC